MGPSGLTVARGEKGDRGEKGEPGKDGIATDASTIRALVTEEIKKLTAVGSSISSGIPMAEINADCTVLKPKEDKFRLVFKKGMTFCLQDGELVETVRRVNEGGYQAIEFSVPGSNGWACQLSNVCRFDWLKEYDFHIEK